MVNANFPMICKSGFPYPRSNSLIKNPKLNVEFLIDEKLINLDSQIFLKCYKLYPKTAHISFFYQLCYNCCMYFLQELGDVENWAKSIEADMRTLSSALEYVYRKGKLKIHPFYKLK